MNAALLALEAEGLVVEARSALYETPPWGPITQGPYLNQVVAVACPFGPQRLLEIALRVERQLGRDRSREVRFGPRRIDIDILLFGAVEIDEPGLVLPHPRLLGRAFALVPLVEIAPDIIVSGMRAADALAGLDGSGIRKLAPSAAEA